MTQGKTKRIGSKVQGNSSKKRNHLKGEEDGQEYLTPMDFIHLIRTDPGNIIIL